LTVAAEQARDAGSVGEYANVKVGADVTAVLSVRLRMDQLRAIRETAAQRGISISSLLQQAVAQVVAKPEPRMTVTQQVTRLWVRGAEPEMESGGGVDETESGGGQDANKLGTKTGGFALAVAR
jgi:hypothetical protein